MIKETSGNLLNAEAEALVNTVNCVGVMGKGIALQFRQAYPEMFREYAKACKAGKVRPGKMWVYETGSLHNPKFIINFPTKRHWKGKARIEDIEAGLHALVADLKRLKIKSVAVPPLGCGNGGLDWNDVRPRIVKALGHTSGIQVQLFKPSGAPPADAIRVETEKPAMTRGRALVIKLLQNYFIPGYRASMIEIQKLAYFLQEAGEQLRLHFVRDKYGPYAEGLQHVLQKTEGHYTRGYGDRTSNATSQIALLPGSTDAADALLQQDTSALERLARVHKLIEGFENPYGMELLATVHWIVKECPEATDNVEIVVKKIREWSTRKRELFSAEDVRTAWRRLKEEGWLQHIRLFQP